MSAFGLRLVRQSCARVGTLTAQRIVIVGGPRCGKSTLARELRAQGIPTYCGDPKSMVKEPEDGVIYLREGLGMGSASSQWVIDHWLPMPGPWVLEGHVMARVLRKWSDGRHWTHMPCDKVIVFRKQHKHAVTLTGQITQHKGVITVWDEIADRFRPITELRS